LTNFLISAINGKPEPVRMMAYAPHRRGKQAVSAQAGQGGLAVSGRDYTIKLNGLECGVLMGVIMQLDAKQRQALSGGWEQLVQLKKKAEEEAGVKKEIIPGGMLRITDKDGTVIIREPYPFEIEGN